MQYQLNVEGSTFAIVAENQADVDALIHFFHQSLYMGEPELSEEIMFELNGARQHFVRLGEQPSLFDDKVSATAPVAIENKMPAASSEEVLDPNRWMTWNAEFEAGKEAGFRGDVILAKKSEPFHQGYDIGASIRQGGRAQQ